MQGGEQALLGQFVESQALGAVGKVLLDVLIALGEFFHQIGGGAEVRCHFLLIATEAILQVIHLTLHLVWSGIGQQAGNQEPDDAPDDQGECRQQPAGEGLFHANPSSIDGFALR
ncbi:hypothetical protein D3C81_1512020 [compost metagenome]